MPCLVLLAGKDADFQSLSWATWATKSQMQNEKRISESRGLWLANCCFAILARPKMPSGANVFEISDIQEEETEVWPVRRTGCNNALHWLKTCHHINSPGTCRKGPGKE
jgi:hypothetical protein